MLHDEEMDEVAHSQSQQAVIVSVEYSIWRMLRGITMIPAEQWL